MQNAFLIRRILDFPFLQAIRQTCIAAAEYVFFPDWAEAEVLAWVSPGGKPWLADLPSGWDKLDQSDQKLGTQNISWASIEI